jgi:RHS repeat-associated protein
MPSTRVLPAFNDFWTAKQRQASTPITGHLCADPLGRVFQRLRYSVSGGSPGNSLKEKLWYDPAGNVMKRQPEGTRQFEKFQFDALGRTQAVAEYGTNGGSSLSRPATIPARSDTVLVTSTVYDDAGRVEEVIDPKGIKNRTEYDAANRKTSTIENFVQGGTNPDQNRTTEMTWMADNQLKTLKAKNSETGDQTTTWVYGTTLSDSDVARNDLVRAKEFPDKSSASDRVEYKYNRVGEVKEIKDQIGTVRVLQYDKLGREVHGRVTTLGSGVDGAVRRISRIFNVRGLLAKLTRWNNASVGSGSVVNENEYAYDGFGLLTSEKQSHSGAVDGETPKVQYAYTNGAANHARRTSITYPDNTVLALNYGSANAVDDVLNRLKQLRFGSTVLADYSYLGQVVPVIANSSSQPGVELTYFTSGGTGEGGDQYTGLDRFGRIVDQRWRKTSDNTDRERVKYGYDRASNRQWRQNTVAASGQNEFYTYDGLEQVKTLKRGTQTGSPPTGIDGTPVWEEDWNYDPSGNWRGSSTAYLTKENGSTMLNQNREHNVANEIEDIITNSGTAWPVPTHDGAGNMRNVPRPLSLGNSFDLKWDTWNRLVEVKETGGSVVATYGYDGAHRRVTKVAGGNTRHYYYSDQWQVLEERLNALTTADRRFVWGVRSIDDLVLRNHGATRHYALSDAMGSVTAIVNTSGTVQERYGYDGFGQPRYMDASFGSRANSSHTWETLFDGYRYDTESGLYQVRYRYLHPRLGRWPNRDPMSGHGDVNLHAFVGDNPLVRIDRLGLYWHIGQPPGYYDPGTGQWVPFPGAPGTPSGPGKLCIDWEAYNDCAEGVEEAYQGCLDDVDAAFGECMKGADTMYGWCMDGCSYIPSRELRVLCEFSCSNLRRMQQSLCWAARGGRLRDLRNS